MVTDYAGYCQAHLDMPKTAAPPAINFWPSIYVGAGYLMIFFLFSDKSVTVATVLTLALAAFVILYYATNCEELKGTYTLCLNALHVWSDAPDDVRETTWKPSLQRWQRVGLLFMGIFGTAVTFVIATSYGSCFDKWGSWNAADFSKPYAWLYLPFTGLVTQENPAYRWCLAQAVIMTLLMPPVIFATVWLPALNQIRTWERNAKDEPDNRSELDKLIDKSAS
jgi:hypothetical protein